ncbi:MAG TPA: molybdenum cofactor guanylyltransferase [Thermoanaerobaculia bacterium]
MNAYVLAGGRSSRMGVSKTELFLERVVAAARPLFDELVAVQRPRGESVDALRTIDEEPHDADGPIFGVARALRDARADCFILAVDYPLVTTAVLRFLRDERRVAQWNGRAQPLCAVWPYASLRALEERIAARRFDLQGLPEAEMIGEALLRARFPGEPLLNVNTPEEWQVARRLHGE